MVVLEYYEGLTRTIAYFLCVNSILSPEVHSCTR